MVRGRWRDGNDGAPSGPPRVLEDAVVGRRA